MLIYHVNWHNAYFDFIAVCLSTADPFVHPVTCILVSQRYRAGYKAALRDILSRFRECICNCACASKVKVNPLNYTASDADSCSNRVTWSQESHGTLRNNCERTLSMNAEGPSTINLGVILEVKRT